MVHETFRSRMRWVVRALGASLVLGLLTGRLVGSDDPMNITPRAATATSMAATPDQRPGVAIATVRRSASQVIVPLTAPLDTSVPSPVPSPATPDAATPSPVNIVGFDGSLVALPTVGPPD